MSRAIYVCSGCAHIHIAYPKPSKCEVCGQDETWLDAFEDFAEACYRSDEVLRSIRGGSVKA